MLIGSDDGVETLFVWEETRVPQGKNPRGQAGDDLPFPHTTPEIEPGSHW